MMSFLLTSWVPATLYGGIQTCCTTSKSGTPARPTTPSSTCQVANSAQIIASIVCWKCLEKFFRGEKKFLSQNCLKIDRASVCASFSRYNLCCCLFCGCLNILMVMALILHFEWSIIIGHSFNIIWILLHHRFSDISQSPLWRKALHTLYSQWSVLLLFKERAYTPNQRWHQ